MAEQPLRVLIAGGGVAGLETLMALRALAGERVALAMVAPEDEFVYRPLSVKEPYSVGRMRHVALSDAAAEADAQLFPLRISAVDPAARVVSTERGRDFEYDALVLALGADAVAAVEPAVTWDDRTAAETLGGLLRDFEHGYSRRLGIVIPPGPVWPLRAYELALLVTRDAHGMGVEIHTTLVSPEPSPLQALGAQAVQVIAEVLAEAGVAVVSADRVQLEAGQPTILVAEPSGLRIAVDRVLALPALRGRQVAGVPVDAQGFIPIDQHCRVVGLSEVWAVGDISSFPVKSGGFAAEQADVAAEAIAASAGAPVEPRAFEPADRRELAALPAGRYLEAWLGAVEGEELSTHLPALGVPALTYLQRDFEAGWRGEV